MSNALMSYDASEIMNDQLLYTKPWLIAVQLQLMSPGFSSTAKWVIFDPFSRRSFLVCFSSSEETESSGGGGAGHASVSDTVKVLALASGKGVRLSELLNDGIIADAVTVKSLLSAGILNGDLQAPATAGSFVDRYHRAVFDYPFHDYFDPQWREKDEAAMVQYKAAWPPPEPLTMRQGEAFPLPAPSDIELLKGDQKSILDIPFLSSVLHKTFGVIEERQRPVVGTVVRKTSPSGGCRHPSEVVVLFPHGVENIPRGAYHYDVGRHQLVVAPEYAAQVDAVAGPCGFIVTSHVERAMWRYRDIRSFRAIPLDAGHVIETLVLLLGLREFDCTVSGVGSLSVPNLGWYQEPEVAFVTTGPATKPREASVHSNGSPVESFVINPSLYFTFENGEICANILWPWRRSVNVTSSELQFIAGRLADTSGNSDRSQDRDMIQTEGLKELVNAGLVLTEPAATSIYAGVKLWSRYGWYLTLLAHLEVIAAQAESANRPNPPARIERLGSLSGPRLVEALMHRATCRSFSSSPVAMEIIANILRETFAYGFGDCTELGAQLRVFMCPLAVEGGAPSVHEWSAVDATLHPLDIALDRNQIRRMTIGQEAISGAAAIVWMFVEFPENDPATYELILLTLGRLGQRLCLLATDANLGAFMTPAVSDALIFDTLGIQKAERHATYAFGLGYRRK